MLTNSKSWALFLFLIVITLMLYWPGLSGGFIFDDGNSITQNSSIQVDKHNKDTLLAAAFSRDTGPLKRPISMASFAINHAFTGLDPFYFKLTNVFIHLLSGLLLYVLLRKIFTHWAAENHGRFVPSEFKNTLPLLITAAWLLHPLNVSTVLYAVQRMTELASLFTLLGVVTYCWGRERILAGKSLGLLTLLLALIVPGALAIYSKENGALLPLFICVVECCVYRFKTSTKLQKNSLIAFYTIAIAIPALFVLVTLIISPEKIVGNYSYRTFNLSERIFSEARIVFFYLQQILIPIPSTMGLFHDGYPLSKGLFDPFNTFTSIVGHIGLLTLAIISLRNKPLIAFSILWFYVGHSMESTVYPLEPVFEHRNYLAMLGPVLLIFYGIHKLFFHAQQRAIYTSLICLLVLSAGLYARAEQWSSPTKHLLAEVKNHPSSSRANDYAGYIYETAYKQKHEPSHLKQAIYHYERSSELNANFLDPLISLAILKDNANKQEATEQLIERLKHGLPHSNWLNALQTLIKKSTTETNTESIISSLLENPRIRGKRKAETYNLLAMNAEKNKQSVKAGEFIRKAIEIQPQNILFQIGYASWLESQNRHAEALNILKEANKQRIRASMQLRLREKISRLERLIKNT